MEDCFMQMTFSGTCKAGRWWQGSLHDAWGRVVALVAEGVVDFTFAEDFWPKRNLRELDASGAIQNNWQTEWEHVSTHSKRLALCQAAVASAGTILELAAGPGGGNLSAILHLDPQARVIVNDLESRLLHRWQQFISGEMPAAPVMFAAFDAIDMPLRTGSIACISSAGGLSNVRGSLRQLLQECVRVLGPGGKIVAYELTIAADTLGQLPEELHSLWAVNPWLVNHWQQQFAAAGMRVVSNQVSEVRRLDPTQDGLAIDASSFGVEVIAEWRCIVAEKVDAQKNPW